MRRRGIARRLSADETVALFARAENDAAGLDDDAARAYVAGVLSLHETDVVRALRARRWIRRGRPASYKWDL